MARALPRDRTRTVHAASFLRRRRVWPLLSFVQLGNAVGRIAGIASASMHQRGYARPDARRRYRWSSNWAASGALRRSPQTAPSVEERQSRPALALLVEAVAQTIPERGASISRRDNT